jgi:hypothetical protein
MKAPKEIDKRSGNANMGRAFVVFLMADQKLTAPRPGRRASRDTFTMTIPTGRQPGS